MDDIIYEDTLMTLDRDHGDLMECCGDPAQLQECTDRPAPSILKLVFAIQEIEPVNLSD